MYVQPVVVLLIVGCCVALYWRVPVVRPHTRRALPYILIAIGALGLVLALSSSSYDGQPPTGSAASWRGVLLVQSAAFGVAGLWLTFDRRPVRPLMTARGSLLLLPVVAAVAILNGNDNHTHRARIAVALFIVIALSVIVMIIRRPALAADLGAAALAGLGIVGFAVATWPPQVLLNFTVQAVPISDGGQISQPAAVFGSVAGSVDVLAAVQAAAILSIALWLAPRTIGVHARKLLRLGPDPELAGRVDQLTQTRADAVGSAAAELRRVERDLHDGAQARLVALGMNLRAAERLIHTSPQAAVALVAEAREASSQALTELRDLVRGIYPPVLADRGLGDAVRALALDTPIRTETDIDLPGRLESPVESACYFAIAEALANAVKHSGARLVQIRIRYSAEPHYSGRGAAGLLRVEVTDNGTGGADPAQGTGLAGIERRLGTFDGILAVSSPPGGPTMIIMEVPCALSSPRTSSC